MRPVIAILLTLICTGCAHLPTGVSQVQLTARDGGAVYHGAVRREGPAVVSLTVEVGRRVYGGTLELTDPNATFGLYQRFGSREAAPRTAETLVRINFTKSILSSTDNRILTCDFTDVAGDAANGLCVDDAQRIYDVIFS